VKSFLLSDFLLLSTFYWHCFNAC